MAAGTMDETVQRCPSPPGWDGLRRNAESRLKEQGLPTPKSEDWKYLDLKPIRELAFSPCLQVPLDIREHILPEAKGTRLVFFNGRVDDHHSCISAHHGDWVFRPLDPSDELSSSPDTADVFELMNTARFASGVIIRVPRGQRVEMPLHVLFSQRSGDDPVAVFPRIHIILEAQAEMTLVEEYNGEGRYLCAPLIDVELGEGAIMRHERVQRESLDAFHLGTLRARLAHSSKYELRTISLGGRISRQCLNLAILGEGVELRVDGLVLLDEEQVADTHSMIDHTVGHTTSRQVHKCIVDGKSRAIFNGKIFVRPGAQATNAQQQSRNLLLSETARVDTKPQLEIFADDVKCAHGATVGQLDAEELFYLRSRGLDPETARNLLTWAFASEVLNRVSVASLRRSLRHTVMARTHAETLEAEL